MPTTTGRRAPRRPLPPQAPSEDTDGEADLQEGHTRVTIGEEEEGSEGLDDELVAPDGEDEFDEDDALASPHQLNTPLLNLDPPPSYLREISTLASWTVSSSKPGCSIPQLRHPSTTLFWQSDGPQPHYLNIHFFKLVRIVGLRLYLDFEQDESYTPTRIVFLAGSGMNDLQEWGEMKLESPRGWVWADFSGVGDAESDSEDEEDEEGLQRNVSGLRPPNATRTPGNDMSSDSENNAPLPRPPRFTLPQGAAAAEDAMQLDPQSNNNNNTPLTYLIGSPQNLQQQQQQQQQQNSAATLTLNRPTPRLPFAALSPNNTNNHPQSARRTKPPRMPVLRAHLVQIKILENHQNGKDTHLRGLQIFARNDEELSRAEPLMMRQRGGSSNGIKALMGEDVSGFKSGLVMGKGREKGARRAERWDLGPASRSEWDVEPSVR